MFIRRLIDRCDEGAPGLLYPPSVTLDPARDSGSANGPPARLPGDTLAREVIGDVQARKDKSRSRHHEEDFEPKSHRRLSPSRIQLALRWPLAWRCCWSGRKGITPSKVAFREYCAFRKSNSQKMFAITMNITTFAYETLAPEGAA
jgi:hypothetical protein